MEFERVDTISELRGGVLHDPAAMERFLVQLTVNVTEMFRDLSFYLAFRKKIVPLLRTCPFIRIWDEGCATGEEVYSLAIVLQEEGLYDSCCLYATDVDEEVLKKTETTVFPLSSMKEYIGNYLAAGGRESFSDYYTAR